MIAGKATGGTPAGEPVDLPRRSAPAQLAADWGVSLGRRLGRPAALPWMKAKELDLMTEVLLRLRPRTFLEWGAGLSTLHFPTLLPSLEHWTAIEHHRDWVAEIARRNTDPRVEVIAVPPDHGSYPDTRREGTLEDFRSYVFWPEQHAPGARFDGILVDGRARVHCLARALELLAPGGVVILHDANRTAYLDGAPKFAHQAIFLDYRKGRGGVFLGSRDRDLDSVLDLEHHRGRWRTHDRIARVLFMR